MTRTSRDDEDASRGDHRLRSKTGRLRTAGRFVGDVRHRGVGDGWRKDGGSAGPGVF